MEASEDVLDFFFAHQYVACSEQSKLCQGRMGEYKRYFDRSLNKDYISRLPAVPNNAHCGEGAKSFCTHLNCEKND